MGCTQSIPEELALEVSVNRRLSNEFHRAYEEGARACKLLLLGAGDSGKTTWRKQICNLYNKIYATRATRMDVIPVIVENIILGVRTIVAFLKSSDLRSESKSLPLTELLKIDEKSPLTSEVAVMINEFWRSPVVKKAMERKREFQLQDCFPYFADALQAYPEWGGPKWVPSEDECVRARIRTSGIVEEVFQYKSVKFRLFDAGGQRAERRKWIHCFDGVTAVIFVAATSEYDQNLFEDNRVNRLVEGLNLFNETCNSKWFSTTPMLLFLNKVDLFKEKFVLKKVPLNISGLFPTAPDVSVSIEVALKWMADMFLAKRHDLEKPVFVHYTTATDRKNAEKVFQDCALIILSANLGASGLG